MLQVWHAHATRGGPLHATATAAHTDTRRQATCGARAGRCMQLSMQAISTQQLPTVHTAQFAFAVSGSAWARGESTTCCFRKCMDARAGHHLWRLQSCLARSYYNYFSSFWWHALEPHAVCWNVCALPLPRTTDPVRGSLHVSDAGRVMSDLARIAGNKSILGKSPEERPLVGNCTSPLSRRIVQPFTTHLHANRIASIGRTLIESSVAGQARPAGLHTLCLGF